MVELPTGTVTFLFTDVEQSTRLLAQLGSAEYGRVLEEHRTRLRTVFSRGRELDEQGDSLFYAFARADDAVAAAAAGQRALEGLPVRVRMGVHTGQPSVVGDRYVGLDVPRAARIGGAAHGGQVLLSQATRDLAEADTRDLGEHRLKDLTQPQRLHQLVAERLETDFPSLRTLENRPTNLPAQATPLVGRATELGALKELLADDSVRLLTLAGPGGSGKTRLALHAAAEAVELFPNGVWLVSLEAIDDPALFLPTVAQTLGLYESGDQPLDAAVKEYLAQQRVLLVLDNFEQLLDAARTVSNLLAASPQLKVVVTTRAPLRVAAEHVFSVPPLGLPDPASLPGIEALSQYEAVALFVERAHAVAPAFAVTNDNAPAVAELCVQLDGLPLAIELAAARVKLLPPQALLARLGQRLELLRGGPRDRPERQQTLRAALDWSFDLLDEEEQRLFARLGVFAGGFRLEAAEAVCAAGLDAIEALLEISLLRSAEQPDGEPRFFMLETIRDYANEQLEKQGESTEVRDRHARWIGDWLEGRATERAVGTLIGNWEPEDEEHDNARAALAWARESGNVDRELQLAASAGRFYWPNRGLLTQGRRWLDEALERSEGAGADVQRRALVMLAAAHFAWRQGDPSRCEELAAQAQSVFERLDDRPSLAHALMARGIAAEWRGDLAAEGAFYETAERLFRELNNTEALNSILNNRAYAEVIVGNFESAERRLRELADTTSGMAKLYVFANHGLALAQLGRLDEAAARFVPLLGDPKLEEPSGEIRMYAVEGLATIAGSRADDVRAARLWGAAAAIREATGSALAAAEQRFHDEVAAEVQARVGEDAFDQAWNEGRLLSAKQAVELALMSP